MTKRKKSQGSKGNGRRGKKGKERTGKKGLEEKKQKKKGKTKEKERNPTQHANGEEQRWQRWEGKIELFERQARLKYELFLNWRKGERDDWWEWETWCENQRQWRSSSSQQSERVEQRGQVRPERIRIEKWHGLEWVNRDSRKELKGKWVNGARGENERRPEMETVDQQRRQRKKRWREINLTCHCNRLMEEEGKREWGETKKRMDERKRMKERVSWNKFKSGGKMFDVFRLRHLRITPRVTLNSEQESCFAIMSRGVFGFVAPVVFPIVFAYTLKALFSGLPWTPSSSPLFAISPSILVLSPVGL